MFTTFTFLVILFICISSNFGLVGYKIIPPTLPIPEILLCFHKIQKYKKIHPSPLDLVYIAFNPNDTIPLENDQSSGTYHSLYYIGQVRCLEDCKLLKITWEVKPFVLLQNSHQISLNSKGITPSGLKLLFHFDFFGLSFSSLTINIFVCVIQFLIKIIPMKTHLKFNPFVYFVSSIM